MLACCTLGLRVGTLKRKVWHEPVSPKMGTSRTQLSSEGESPTPRGFLSRVSILFPLLSIVHSRFPPRVAPRIFHSVSGSTPVGGQLLLS